MEVKHFGQTAVTPLTLGLVLHTDLCLLLEALLVGDSAMVQPVVAAILIIGAVVGLSSSLPRSKSHARDLLEIIRTSKRDSGKRNIHEMKQELKLKALKAFLKNNSPGRSTHKGPFGVFCNTKVR